ncbi:hypothetical protein D9757_000741 [Collybiopsis confluens]|uniref:E3 ubiquitin protein ligase n=1 Tax=Collybiopsis confluens TaxID=2823264 RepID=A0A8H5MGH9_9AGAR|nr:hypothetical protein D9757_000741 [Collybiopsis confluens]
MDRVTGHRNLASSVSLMAETRKRSHSVEDDKVFSKKHIISDTNGSPTVNGHNPPQNEDVEPTADDKLELFRKEAIYRRMLHYSRQNEASQQRISELEARKNAREAGLAAMSACWTQLINTIRVMINPATEPGDIMPPPKDMQDLFMLSTYVTDQSLPELRYALEENERATHQLVMKLMQKGSSDVSQDATMKEYQKMQSECSALRAKVEVLQVRLEDSEECERTLRRELAEEQNRVLRLRSKTVQATLPRALVQPTEATGDGTFKPSSPSPNGNKLQEELEERYAMQMRILREQDKIIAELRKSKDLVEIEMRKKTIDKDEVSKSPIYQRVLQRAADALNIASMKEDEMKHLKTEFSMYKERREIYEKELRDDSANAINDTLNLISRRDADIARLREERDQRSAELNERRSKESVRFASCEEYKSLAASRADRIVALESHLHRARLKLAANAGREDLVHFLLETPNKDAEFVVHLQARLSESETRMFAFEEALSRLKEDHPNVEQHIQSEAEALRKLSEVSSQLAKFRNVYGEIPSADSSQMTSELQRKEDELQRLRLLDRQHTQAESALYTEIEKLSSAWESLDGQVRSKVLDLNVMEERLSKATVERAKSDNKYYAAVREKDTIEAERKSTIRSLERQTKAYELLKKSESSLGEQLKAVQSELDKYRAYCQETHEGLMKGFTSKSLEMQERVNEGSKLAIIYRDKVSEYEQAHLSRQDALRKEIDAMSNAKVVLERERLALQSKAKFDSTHQQNKSDPDANVMRLLKCSTCNVNFRDTILTKCSHTFCKSCVEARISSRQRKCPACGLGFAQSEVLKVFMQ